MCYKNGQMKIYNQKNHTPTKHPALKEKYIQQLALREKEDSDGHSVYEGVPAAPSSAR